MLFSRETIRRNNPLLLALLVAGDIFFVIMFGLLGFGIIHDEGFSLIHDRTYPEIYQYIKLFWVSLCFAYLLVTHRQILYALFLALSVYILFDDYFQIHEYSGVSLALKLHIPDALMVSSYDFGELIIFAAMGCIFLPLFAYCYRISSAAIKKQAVVLLGFLFALAFFAIAVDFLHALHLPFTIRHSIGSVEDGGEMIVISGMFWYVYNLVSSSINRENTNTAT